MISDEKLNGALGALAWEFVAARRMADTQRSQADISRVLEHAEYLPRLLSVERIADEEYRSVQGDLAGFEDLFKLSLACFDNPLQAW